MSTPPIRRAAPADAPALTALINDAYEVETDIIAGKRTNLAAIESMLTADVGQFFVIDASADATSGPLAACVYTEIQPDPDVAGGKVAYLGLLSVRPGQQKGGLGKRLIAHVVDRGRDAGCNAVTITVVSVRHELFPYYEALGFVRAGVQPYRDPSAVRVPGLHLVRMRRAL